MATEEKSIFHYMTHRQAIMCLTFIGGFVDAVGYVMMFELFTASITGNIVAAMVPLWREDTGFASRAVVVACVGLGAGLVTMYSMKLRFATDLNKWEIGLRLFSWELAALFLALVVGPNLTFPSVKSDTVFIQGALMGFAMGAQNGAAMVLIPNCPPTTAMTGNTVRFYIYGAEALNFWLASKNYIDLYPEKVGKPLGYDEKMQKYCAELTQKFYMFLASLGPFTVGAALGLGAAIQMGMACLIFPFFVVVWILFCINQGLKEHRNLELALMGAGASSTEVQEVAVSPMYAGVAAAEALEQHRTEKERRRSLSRARSSSVRASFREERTRTKSILSVTQEAPPAGYEMVGLALEEGQGHRAGERRCSASEGDIELGVHAVEVVDGEGEEHSGSDEYGEDGYGYGEEGDLEGGGGLPAVPSYQLFQDCYAQREVTTEELRSFP